VWPRSALRQPGATAVTFVVWVLAIASTLRGLGPVRPRDAAREPPLLQLFMAVVACTGLLLGAAIAERDAAERRRAADFRTLELSEHRFRLALETGAWRVGLGRAPARRLRRRPSTLSCPSSIRTIARASGRASAARSIALPLRGRAPEPLARRRRALDRARRAPSSRGDRPSARVRRHRRRRDGRDALEEALRERAAALVEADRRKDEFLAMLAHELRNPLARSR
jgi:signal transduction histidine kinase